MQPADPDTSRDNAQTGDHTARAESNDADSSQSASSSSAAAASFSFQRLFFIAPSHPSPHASTVHAQAQVSLKPFALELKHAAGGAEELAFQLAVKLGEASNQKRTNEYSSVTRVAMQELRSLQSAARESALTAAAAAAASRSTRVRDVELEEPTKDQLIGVVPIKTDAACPDSDPILRAEPLADGSRGLLENVVTLGSTKVAGKSPQNYILLQCGQLYSIQLPQSCLQRAEQPPAAAAVAQSSTAAAAAASDGGGHAESFSLQLRSWKHESISIPILSTLSEATVALEQAQLQQAHAQRILPALGPQTGAKRKINLADDVAGDMLSGSLSSKRQRNELADGGVTGDIDEPIGLDPPTASRADCSSPSPSAAAAAAAVKASSATASSSDAGKAASGEPATCAAQAQSLLPVSAATAGPDSAAQTNSSEEGQRGSDEQVFTTPVRAPVPKPDPPSNDTSNNTSNLTTPDSKDSTPDRPPSFSGGLPPQHRVSPPQAPPAAASSAQSTPAQHDPITTPLRGSSPAAAAAGASSVAGSSRGHPTPPRFSVPAAAAASFMVPPSRESEVASLTASNASLQAELYRSWEAHSLTQGAMAVVVERLKSARAELERCHTQLSRKDAELASGRATIERLINQVRIYDAAMASAVAESAAHSLAIAAANLSRARDPSASPVPSPDAAAASSNAASSPEP